MNTPLNANHIAIDKGDMKGHGGIDYRGANNVKDRQRLRFDSSVMDKSESRQRQKDKANSSRRILQDLPLRTESAMQERGTQQSTSDEQRNDYVSHSVYSKPENYHHHQQHSSDMLPHQQRAFAYPPNYGCNEGPHSTLQSYPQPRVINEPPPPPHAVVGITSSHFAERFDTSAQQLNSYQQMIGSRNNENVPNMNAGSMVDAVRRASVSNKNDNLRSIVEHRSKSAETAENHVSWLDNLRKELSQFPHTTASGTSDKQNVFGGGVMHSSAGGQALDFQYLDVANRTSTSLYDNNNNGKNKGSVQSVYRV